MKSLLKALKKNESNIEDTYYFLRLSMGIIAIAFPLALWLGGRIIFGVPPQASISAYYHTDMRDLMVGCLFAIGLCLLIYKGFSFSEDWLLNLAGALIIAVAYFPMDPAKPFRCFPPCEEPCISYYSILDHTPDILIKIGIHGICSVLFFIAIGLVCAFCSKKTLHLVEEKYRKLFLYAYRVLGILMVVLPLSVAVILRLPCLGVTECTDRTIFWIETSGIWVFAVFWLIKTYEGSRYGADRTYLNRRGIPYELARKI